jgi:predicted nucleotidyltransferase
LKKETLLSNLEKVVKKLPNLDLPAEIAGIYAFGSILREKENPHDIDLIVLYTLSPAQNLRWERFQKNFSDDNWTGNYLRKIKKYLLPYQARGVSLSDAVKEPELSNLLREHEIEPSWAGCFSWTAVLGYDPYGFTPSLNAVMYRMLFGRRIKGFQVKFLQGQFLKEGHIPMMTAKNHWLIWSKERSDVYANLTGRTIDEKTSHNTKELDHFTNDEIPRYKKEFLEAKEAALKNAEKREIKISFSPLEFGHADIQRTGSESLSELAKKCELARIQMKKYSDATIVLRIIAYSSGCFRDYSQEEYLSRVVIENSRRRGLSEQRSREILRTLGLPEDHIITVKKYGFGTYYELAKTNEEKSKLLVEVEKEKKRERLLRPIIKAVHLFDPRAEVHLEYNKDGAPEELSICVFVQTNELSDEEISRNEEELRKRGFRIEKTSWCLDCSKFISLRGTETKEELLEIAKKMMIE